ncbi:ABC transporter permease [Nonomuraea roseoviolacea subsp. roseoviolacea]|uniref:Ribose transport system permease protein n=1 Tax=Nonomuraea roseoviolacea subsp. carminata TaxID=160689 RepID=A0ABT1KAL4_9ACTN|nr:ABC transporter permease [Nonomuraea roseoviolacea]MCP2351058.1 ribose transport system permease protein [Nonomuraea roseoviolacea subsp. carminata]
MAAGGRARPRRSAPGRLVGAYGLLALAVLLFAVFSLALPATFPTAANLRLVLSTNAVVAVLALGAMVPIVTGKFDLSIGYGLGLGHVVTLELIVTDGWPWPPACLGVLVGGAVAGVVNGLLVEFARIDSFIATLGTGSVLYAITGWVTGGARVVPGPEGLPVAFTNLTDATVLGLPLPALYVAALTAVLWVALERLPLGRYLYVIGSNPRAAELVGIPTRRYVCAAFTVSGLVTGFAGVLLAAQNQIGNPSVGLDYLLPAFTAALLGSSVIRPGRPNPLGTVVAVGVLAVGLSGLGQLGADFWVTPLFNGLTLLAAVGLVGWSARRRMRARPPAAEPAPAPPSASLPPAPPPSSADARPDPPAGTVWEAAAGERPDRERRDQP